jgi:hypothetical protein
MRRMFLIAGLAGFALMPRTIASGQGIAARGTGRSATAAPPGLKSPPAEIYRTETVRGKMPTNDWWSSLAWLPDASDEILHLFERYDRNHGTETRVEWTGAPTRSLVTTTFGFETRVEENDSSGARPPATAPCETRACTSTPPRCTRSMNTRSTCGARTERGNR